MFSKTLILSLPTLSLLLSSSPTIAKASTFEYSYANQLDMLQVSAVAINSVTKISAIFSFSNANPPTRQFTLHRLNPNTNEYDSIESKKTSGKVAKLEFDYVETLSATSFIIKGYNGPRFKISYRVALSSKTVEFDTNFCSDTRYGRKINTYHSEENIIESSYNGRYIDNTKGIDTYFAEEIEITDYVKDAIYDFDSQNYIDPSFKLFKFHHAPLIYNPIFCYDETYLFFNDRYSVFNNLHETTPTVTLKGRLELGEDDFYHFVINEDLYIDPSTRVMYRTPKNGLIKTNKLYFPISFPSEFNDSLNYFSIFVKGLGLNKETLVTRLDLGKLSDNMIGDCATSSYCVSSYFDDPDFSLGKVEERNA